MRHLRWALATSVLAVLMLPAAALASWTVSTFAKVPAPGYPADAVLGSGGTVYAGTFKPLEGGSDAPSKVFAFNPDGSIARSYVISGQTPGQAHGVQVATSDAAGRLYLLDQAPARVVVLDPSTGEQSTWATFPTLPGGDAPEPDFAAWGPDGSLYVTDYAQYVIWRIPPGGGTAKVWLSDPALNGIIVGPAGIQLMADHRTLMFDTGAGGSNITAGKLFTVPIQADGSPGPLHQIWESTPLQVPDGFALAASGNIYLTLVGPLANQVLELSPDGKLLNETPADPLTTGPGIPLDAPGSVLFDGDNIIVGNQSAILENPAHMALLELEVGEPGLPVYVPPAAVSAPTQRLRLLVTPTRPALDAAVRTSFTVTAAGKAVAGATIRMGKHIFSTGHDGTGQRNAALSQRPRAADVRCHPLRLPVGHDDDHRRRPGPAGFAAPRVAFGA